MQNKFLELIQDKTGKLSTSRLSFLLWSTGALIIWLYLTYHNRSMADVPEGVRWILGILVSNRVGQKYLDKNQPTVITNNNTTTK